MQQKNHKQCWLVHWDLPNCLGSLFMVNICSSAKQPTRSWAATSARETKRPQDAAPPSQPRNIARPPSRLTLPLPPSNAPPTSSLSDLRSPRVCRTRSVPHVRIDTVWTRGRNCPKNWKTDVGYSRFYGYKRFFTAVTIYTFFIEIWVFTAVSISNFS